MTVQFYDDPAVSYRDFVGENEHYEYFKDYCLNESPDCLYKVLLEAFAVAESSRPFVLTETYKAFEQWCDEDPDGWLHEQYLDHLEYLKQMGGYNG